MALMAFLICKDVFARLWPGFRKSSFYQLAPLLVTLFYC